MMVFASVCFHVVWLLLFLFVGNSFADDLRREKQKVKTPARRGAANYFHLQWVDHTDDDKKNSPYFGRTWSQRFYTLNSHFKGPGSPIFLILGGEGGIEPSRGVMYPFVTDHLAVSFGAFVLEPEHRFYGASRPVSRQEIMNATDNVDPRSRLLTPEQAIRDALRLTRFVQHKLHCSPDRFSVHYCPVIVVGGSYSGFLSSMARLLFPFTVDMSYAASAPVKFYAQEVEQSAYYHHITAATETAFPGCSLAVQMTLDDVMTFYRNQTSFNAKSASLIGVCDGTLPSYINDTQTFLDEIIMMAGYSFANANMAYYPPSSSFNMTSLGAACHSFMNKNTTMSSLDRLSDFFVHALSGSTASPAPADADAGNVEKTCFNMSHQVPSGPHGTISAGDWSGVGTGSDGESWDFQTCTLLVEQIGFGTTSHNNNNNTNTMFPPRQWTNEWLDRHCQARFGVTPQPTKLVEQWHFDDFVSQGASRILFTNGLVDGWSVSGIAQNVSDTIVAINFPNGSHHSDLSYGGNAPTADLTRGRAQIRTILAEWLSELEGGRFSTKAIAPL